MKKILIVCAVSFHFLVIQSCKDKCPAGLGGSLTIVAYPQHHGKPIPSHTTFKDTAYVKSCVQEFPGRNPALYDVTFTGDVGQNYVRIEGLQPGEYFIYMVGFDTTISLPVRGGIPYNTDQGDVIVPVTE